MVDVLSVEMEPKATISNLVAVRDIAFQRAWEGGAYKQLYIAFIFKNVPKSAQDQPKHLDCRP